MNTAKEFCVIMGISFIGECLGKVLPFPVPASIYGMVILFVALCIGIIRVEQIEKISDALLEVMPMLFVPAGVGLINQMDELKVYLWPIVLVLFVTTAVVMGVTGKIAQIIMHLKEKEHKKDAESVQ